VRNRSGEIGGPKTSLLLAIASLVEGQKGPSHKRIGTYLGPADMTGQSLGVQNSVMEP
jgi:hypothetical protein